MRWNGKMANSHIAILFYFSLQRNRFFSSEPKTNVNLDSINQQSSIMGKVESPSPSTPYTQQTSDGTSVAAEVVNGMTHGQTLYVRKVERSCSHKFALCINVLVIIAAVGLVIGQIWGLAIKSLGLMEVVMRSYLIAIGGMIMMNEMEASSVLSKSPILQKFFWRGVFYSFIGTLGTLLNDIGNDDYYNNWNKYKNGYNNNNGYVTFMVPSLEHALEIFIGVSATILFIMGCTYVVLGFMVYPQKKIERDIDQYRERLHLAEAALSGEQDVIRRRFGGRLGEEVGLA